MANKSAVSKKCRENDEYMRRVFDKVMIHSHAYANAIGFTAQEMRNSRFDAIGGGICYVGKTGYDSLHTLGWQDIIELLTVKEKARFFDAIFSTMAQQKLLGCNSIEGDYSHCLTKTGQDNISILERDDERWVTYNTEAVKTMFAKELSERIGSHEIIVYIKHLCGCKYGDTWRNVVMAKPAKSCPDEYCIQVGGGTSQMFLLCEKWHEELVRAIKAQKDSDWWMAGAHIWP
jgi:hypothetical protein